MSTKKNFTYEPLDSPDDASRNSEELPSYQPGTEYRRPRSRWSILMIWFVIQVSNIVLFSSGYALLQFSRSRNHRGSPDPYFELTEYNTTNYFTGNVSLVTHSVMADEFWNRIQDTGGVVSVDTEWALKYFPPSRSSPDNPEHSIYEVDVFHSIHCLYRIRNRLIAQHPKTTTDGHTLHCVDYLREQIMCHGDIILQATDNFIGFGDLSIGHQCRDHDALVSWTKKHEWKGHKKFLEEHNGIKFKEEVVDAHAATEVDIQL
ncbi:hypothetical protein N431DRAFT_473862 [Stipitochalara longipes BDJ]|nr:hypothetical protein N431DRAFT_473862 [Stipitochalara longipes BDJ]